MKTVSPITRILAIFLILGLALPSNVLALRPQRAGLEEIENALGVSTGLEERSREWMDARGQKLKRMLKEIWEDRKLDFWRRGPAPEVEVKHESIMVRNQLIPRFWLTFYPVQDELWNRFLYEDVHGRTQPGRMTLILLNRFGHTLRQRLASEGIAEEQQIVIDARRGEGPAARADREDLLRKAAERAVLAVEKGRAPEPIELYAVSERKKVQRMLLEASQQRGFFIEGRIVPIGQGTSPFIRVYPRKASRLPSGIRPTITGWPPAVLEALEKFRGDKRVLAAIPKFIRGPGVVAELTIQGQKVEGYIPNSKASSYQNKLTVLVRSVSTVPVQIMEVAPRSRDLTLRIYDDEMRRRMEALKEIHLEDQVKATVKTASAHGLSVVLEGSALPGFIPMSTIPKQERRLFDAWQGVAVEGVVLSIDWVEGKAKLHYRSLRKRNDWQAEFSGSLPSETIQRVVEMNASMGEEAIREVLERMVQYRPPMKAGLEEQGRQRMEQLLSADRSV